MTNEADHILWAFTLQKAVGDLSFSLADQQRVQVCAVAQDWQRIHVHMAPFVVERSKDVKEWNDQCMISLSTCLGQNSFSSRHWIHAEKISDVMSDQNSFMVAWTRDHLGLKRVHSLTMLCNLGFGKLSLDSYMLTASIGILSSLPIPTSLGSWCSSLGFTLHGITSHEWLISLFLEPSPYCSSNSQL